VFHTEEVRRNFPFVDANIRPISVRVNHQPVGGFRKYLQNSCKFDFVANCNVDFVANCNVDFVSIGRDFNYICKIPE